MSYPTENLRIQWTKVLLPPVALDEEFPIPEKAARTVHETRGQICSILSGTDPRLLVVVGPCSIHDTQAAREYAAHLSEVQGRLSEDLLLVMRVYFEKPRTTVGWKGLINDPYFDQSYKINDGLRLARHLLVDLGEMGLPVGTEFLDLITPQYLAGLVSWGAIGARTAESQLHRELASGLSCPIGFKNGTSGNVQVAIEAIESAAYPHCFLGHTAKGESAIFYTTGNLDCHIVLRGGRLAPNFTPECVDKVCRQLEAADRAPRVMIDCSHANSRRDHLRQPEVCREVIRQICAGDRRIIGVMLESNLVAGAQELSPRHNLVYGQSITDACLGWEETKELLEGLAQAVHSSRQSTHSPIKDS